MGGRGGPGRQGGSGESVMWRDAVPVELNSRGSQVDPPNPKADLSPQQLAKAERDLMDILGRLSKGDWVRLPAVRDAMSARGYGLGAQNTVLNRVALRPTVRVIPIANLKSLSGEDRRASLYIGGEYKHAIMYNPQGA